MRIIGCPGQGSQSQGFLLPWLEAFPALKDRLSNLSQSAGRDLVRLGTVADEEELRDTSNAQRLIVASAIAVYRELENQIRADAVVGHSVGEFAAAAISGILSDEDAVKLVGIRADAMAAAASKVPTSMAAVVGGDFSSVVEAIEAAGLEPANFNGGQIVAAGLKTNISNLVESPPTGTRVIELKVAGAFHTSFMSEAVQSLRQATSGIVVNDPKLSIWTNRDGTRVSSGQDYLETMVMQTASPVRWDLCMESMNSKTGMFVELPPAGALSGLVKRGAQSLTAVALKTPGDLEKLESI